MPYFSNEFFEDTKIEDVKDVITDIKESFAKNEWKNYQFYKFDDSRIPLTHTYLRNEKYEPRPNQQETIDKFKTAIENDRKNLLMYAVMRFWKIIYFNVLRYRNAGNSCCHCICKSRC